MALASSLLLTGVTITSSQLGLFGVVVGFAVATLAIFAISTWNDRRSLVVIHAPSSMTRGDVDRAMREVPSAESVLVVVDTEEGPKEAFAARCQRRHAESAFAALARLG